MGTHLSAPLLFKSSLQLTLVFSPCKSFSAPPSFSWQLLLMQTTYVEDTPLEERGARVLTLEPTRLTWNTAETGGGERARAATRARPTSSRGFALKVRTSTSRAVSAQSDSMSTNQNSGRTGFTSSAKGQTAQRGGRFASAVMEPSLTGASILAMAVLT